MGVDSGWRFHKAIRMMICMALIVAMLPQPWVYAASEGTAKSGNMSMIYACTAIVSLMLIIGYCIVEKKPEWKFLLLYSAVFLTNTGYFVLSVADTLSAALWANRITYFGAAYAVMLMLLIIMEVCKIPHARLRLPVLLVISTAAFLLAASGGISGVYYSDVSIETVNGVTRLVKVYGPLHWLYMVYLFAYFGMMVASILYSVAKKTLTSPRYAVFLASIVLVNICIWFVEQIIAVDFEFLSVSYIITELFLLLLYSLLRDYDALKRAVGLGSPSEDKAAAELPPDIEEMFDAFAQRTKLLTAAEQRIFQYYIDGHEIAEIPELAYVSIHTVKKHNRSIYQKLEVSSRDELMLYIELFRRSGRLDALLESTE